MVIIATRILIISLLKYVAIISAGVTNPYLLDNIHCLLKKRIPIKEIAITQREVVENGKPFNKVKLGWTKNNQLEKIKPVATIEWAQLGIYLPNIKKSTGVVVFL
tara:strand:- start:411 stop:725 length:315 start_codon:yes stop_codon:yes gene_type:complete